MNTYRIKIGEVTHEVVVDSITPPTAQVTVDGHPYTVSLDQAQAADAPRPAQPAASAPATAAPAPKAAAPQPVACVGEGDVVAPMPGKLLKFLAQVGDTVEAGQPVVVLEAMKMENQLPAPIAGKVVALPVAEGADVKQRTVLMRIEALS
ncbi:MAG TPA: acetyl-CoA carboxylase biotin carboxyl carrier protein subunit [bacterium]|nr:acetyl-CoA carboxylase biotin carboxyl carrier protein subunit [bacterium]